VSDDSEKPFEPTPQRLQKAKREGNVARSAELSANLAFLTAASTLAALVAPAGMRLSAGLARAAATGAPPWSDAAIALGTAIVPMAAAGCAGVLAAALQSGGITVTAVGVKAERLDVASGIKRILSRETAAHAARAAAAFGIAACALWAIVTRACAQVLQAHAPLAMAAAAWHGVRGAALAAAACGLVFALAEYASARRAWLRKLRMSLEERKREAKEHEGDPQARGRRRALHRSFLRGAPSDVKNASFVVVNPTHVAVALRYVPSEMNVPVTVVAAAGEAAARVRELAVRADVPIVDDPPLARALFADAVVGSPIPYDHYVAVAEVVAALSRARSRASR
jgi:flagellar biosynthesis protein FlhB